jgi:hypothetical protein
MEEGRLAGIAAAESLGIISSVDATVRKKSVWERMDTLRTGNFGRIRREAKAQIVAEGGLKYVR